jgi:hypothetical protein
MLMPSHPDERIIVKVRLEVGVQRPSLIPNVYYLSTSVRYKEIVS